MKIYVFNVHMRISLSILEMMDVVNHSFFIQSNNAIFVITKLICNWHGMKISVTNISKSSELEKYIADTQKHLWYVKNRKHNFSILVLKSNLYSKMILELKSNNELSNKICEIVGKRAQ